MPIEDRYEVEGAMGEGGFAHVFRGVERGTGRPVALKILKSAFHDNAEVRERFQREVFAVASLSNPHIVGMYDFGLNETNVYIAMEYVAGATLRERMRTPLTLNERFQIVSQIAIAIDAAHERNVVHRDLKPENIKVVDQPEGGLDVKVLDFGMAKISQLESQLELRPLTKVGVCFGTPHYMSPEQIRGKLDDKSIDLYALTTIAYELIAGKRPWDGEDPYEIMRAVLRNPAPRVMHVEGCTEQDDAQLARINAFFDRALAKTLPGRPLDARAIVNGLEMALFNTSTPISVATTVDAPRLDAQNGNLADATLPMHGSGAITVDVADRAPEPKLEAVEPILPERPHVDPALRDAAFHAAQDFSASRKRGIRGLLVPLLVIAALGGSLGYLLAGSGSSQANEIHDFIVGKK